MKTEVKWREPGSELREPVDFFAIKENGLWRIESKYASEVRWYPEQSKQELVDRAELELAEKSFVLQKLFA